MNSRLESGSCFCGAITAEFADEPFWIGYDHDDDCRKAIGSPLTVWVGYRPNQFLWTRGLPKAFSKAKGVTRTFCSDCGTSIGYVDEGLSDEFYVTIGFLDNPERFQPEAHAYWSLKLPWVDFGDQLPRIEKTSRPRDPAVGNPSEQ